MLKWRKHLNSGSYLGLAISNTAVKLVKLDEKCNIQSYSKACIELSDPSTPAITQAIKESLANLKTTSRKVITALPDTVIMSQSLQIDANLADQKAAVYLAAAPNLPQAFDQLSLDFQIDASTAKDAQRLNALCVVCDQPYLNKRLQAITASGLHVQVVEVNSHALERAYRHFYQIDHITTWALIEIDIQTITLLLWQNKQVIDTYSSDLYRGTNAHAISQITQQLLAVLMLKYSIKHLDTLCIIGDNPVCTIVEENCKRLFCLSHYPSIEPIAKLGCSPEHFNGLQIAAGLALRAYEEN